MTCVRTGEEFLVGYGMADVNYAENVWILVAMIVVYRAIGYVALHYMYRENR